MESVLARGPNVLSRESNKPQSTLRSSSELSPHHVRNAGNAYISGSTCINDLQGARRRISAIRLNQILRNRFSSSRAVRARFSAHARSPAGTLVGKLTEAPRRSLLSLFGHEQRTRARRSCVEPLYQSGGWFCACI